MYCDWCEKYISHMTMSQSSIENIVISCKKTHVEQLLVIVNTTCWHCWPPEANGVSSAHWSSHDTQQLYWGLAEVTGVDSTIIRSTSQVPDINWWYIKWEGTNFTLTLVSKDQTPCRCLERCRHNANTLFKDTTLDGHPILLKYGQNKLKHSR